MLETIPVKGSVATPAAWSSNFGQLTAAAPDEGVFDLGRVLFRQRTNTYFVETYVWFQTTTVTTLSKIILIKKELAVPSNSFVWTSETWIMFLN